LTTLLKRGVTCVYCHGLVETLFLEDLDFNTAQGSLLIWRTENWFIIRFSAGHIGARGPIGNNQWRPGTEGYPLTLAKNPGISTAL